MVDNDERATDDDSVATEIPFLDPYWDDEIVSDPSEGSDTCNEIIARLGIPSLYSRLWDSWGIKAGRIQKRIDELRNVVEHSEDA